MKRYIIMIMAVTLFVLGGCQDYNKLVNNPNLPTAVPPNLLLTGALSHMSEQNAWDGKQGSMSAAQYYVSTYDYYGTNNYDQEPFTKTRNNFEYAGVLQNIVQMDLESKNAGKPDLNPYSAIGKFLRAYYFNLMSQKLGDLPLSEALQAGDNPAPKYDTQKEVYVQILKWLDDANTDLKTLIANNDATLTGDIYFGNDLTKWQKVVNSFTLRVLVSLSHHDTDPDLNVKAKFAAIVGSPANYPVMTGLDDNLQFVFNAAYNPYPKNPTSLGRDGTRENVGGAFLDLTTSLNDPRTFIAATPSPDKLQNGFAFDDYAAYVGAPAGLSMSELGTTAQGGGYSYVNALRYSADFAGSNAEPAIIIGYPELCFNMAEGINRGWASGSADTWYTNGITASMEFLGITEGSSVTVGSLDGKTIYGTVSGISVSDYLAQPSVTYQGGATGLTQILDQKYIAFWQNSNWEAFFNQRRTGVPAFSEGPGSGNANKIAKRWQYPVAEANANTTNYTAAVQSQFGGADDLNGVLWIVD